MVLTFSVEFGEEVGHDLSVTDFNALVIVADFIG